MPLGPREDLVMLLSMYPPEEEDDIEFLPTHENWAPDRCQVMWNAAHPYRAVGTADAIRWDGW
jgi:hypothetical protein